MADIPARIWIDLDQFSQGYTDKAHETTPRDVAFVPLAALTAATARAEQAEAALVAQVQETERAVARAQRLRDGYADAVSALDYVRFHYGELHGVGFDRVRDAYDAIAADTGEAGHE